jgi:hypothetical protein
LAVLGLDEAHVTASVEPSDSLQSDPCHGVACAREGAEGYSLSIKFVLVKEPALALISPVKLARTRQIGAQQELTQLGQVHDWLVGAWLKPGLLVHDVLGERSLNAIRKKLPLARRVLGGLLERDFEAIFI